MCVSVSVLLGPAAAAEAVLLGMSINERAKTGLPQQLYVYMPSFLACSIALSHSRSLCVVE